MTDKKEHCMKEYTPFQQRMSCVNCGEPLNNNQLVNDAYALNTTAVWAREQLNILADMIDYRESITGKEKDWFAKEIRDKVNRIKFLE